jgi:hypothetical protein
MTPPSPKLPPLTLTVDDITETRYGSATARMSWPVDPETTARLRKVIRLEGDAPVAWWRRLLRIISLLRQRP